MTTFLRLLSAEDKANALHQTIQMVREEQPDQRVFEVIPVAFRAVPGSPFSYWVSDKIRDLFPSLPQLESESRHVSLGLSTKNDVRFVRCHWEIHQTSIGRGKKWVRYANGGTFSRFFCDYFSVVLRQNDFLELRAYLIQKFPYLGGSASWILHDENDYTSPVIAWPLRTHSFSPHFLPSDFVFSARTYAAYIPQQAMAHFLALMVSSSCDYLLKVSLGRSGHPEFVTNVVRALPIPSFGQKIDRLSALAIRGWSIMRVFGSTSEISNAFILPVALRLQLAKTGIQSLKEELFEIQSEIDEIASRLYEIEEFDRSYTSRPTATLNEQGEMESEVDEHEAEDEFDGAEAEVEMSIDAGVSLLSWCVGVAFGRFDWRIATGEREVPPEPDPLDPLPVKSPGMLPDGVAPFRAHPGILVDDSGHQHDLPRLMEDVLATVDHPTPEDVRRWLQRDFFPHHLKQYSKNRRKAPIYWPLSTASGSYTLWLYYPALTDQTLYTAANDFVDPKLEETTRLAAALRARSHRSRDEERFLEQLQDLEVELRELQDELLRLAPTWKPDHDDGVQITAAPLWRLFRHRPWQTVLKETWEKLEKADYDWAHLAMSYWPSRVREKCQSDRSLAIAHNLEALYELPPEKPGIGRGGHKGRADAS